MPVKRKAATRTSNVDKLTDADMVEDVLHRLHELLKNEDFRPKVADFLKVLELKHKLKLTQDVEKKLRELIDEIRKEELTKLEDAG